LLSVMIRILLLVPSSYASMPWKITEGTTRKTYFSQGGPWKTASSARWMSRLTSALTADKEKSNQT